jgi:hypothetical protein
MYLVDRDCQFLGQFLRRRFAVDFQHHLTRRAHQSVDHVDDVRWLLRIHVGCSPCRSIGCFSMDVRACAGGSPCVEVCRRPDKDAGGRPENAVNGARVFAGLRRVAGRNSATTTAETIAGAATIVGLTAIATASHICFGNEVFNPPLTKIATISCRRR